jgi:Sulfotransferase family
MKKGASCVDAADFRVASARTRSIRQALDAIQVPSERKITVRGQTPARNAPASMDDSQTTLIKQPLVILSAGRSFGTAVCAMLAQHPRLYGLMETQLFARDSLSAWWEDFGTNAHAHGLLRSAAEMLFGEQTPKTVNGAKRWLWKRIEHSTAGIFEELAGLVFPRMPIDNSPIITSRVEHMERVLESFPEARFLHLTRHPAGYGESLLGFFRTSALHRPAGQTAALLSNSESIFFGLNDFESPDLDPQTPWYSRHSAIASFTSMLPESNRMRVRVEDLLIDPAVTLGTIAAWLELSCERSSIDKMMHPERWAFAGLGPWNARLGGDPEFLRYPTLPTESNEPRSLQGPVPWREDGAEFREDVQRLAQEFGYL